MDIYFLLLLVHIVGTVLGVGGATMIEVHLNKALRDSKMDTVERDFLGSDFLITRVGMFLALVSGIGFIVTYAVNDQLFRLDNGVFWAKMLIFVIIMVNAYLLHVHKIGLYWGSAFSFISWWTVLVFGMFLTNGIRFFPTDTLLSCAALMALYGITVVIGARILHALRERMKMSSGSDAQTTA